MNQSFYLHRCPDCGVTSKKFYPTNTVRIVDPNTVPIGHNASCMTAGSRDKNHPASGKTAACPLDHEQLTAAGIPHEMTVTIDLYGLVEYLFLPNVTISDDDQEVIGLSRVAFIEKHDEYNIFLPAAKWHDAAYLMGASIQETWPRWKVDKKFLNDCLDIAAGNPELEKKAATLWLIVRKYGGKAYEGKEV